MIDSWWRQEHSKVAASIATLRRKSNKIIHTSLMSSHTIKRELSTKDRSLSMQERANKDFWFHKMRLSCEIAEAETACHHP